MATAGLAVGALVLFDLTPIPLFHPIKILGNLSGIAMVVGCIAFTVKRLQTKSDKGTSTYNDWLLIIFVFLVAFTGLLTQTMRLLEVPFLAYNIYFIFYSYGIYLFLVVVCSLFKICTYVLQNSCVSLFKAER
jgi:quinone-modifying oxidoreductase subunit QmoC